MNWLSNISAPRTNQCFQLLWHTATEPPAHQPLWSMKTFPAHLPTPPPSFPGDTTQKRWYWHLRPGRESMASSQAVWLSKTHKRRAALSRREGWLIVREMLRWEGWGLYFLSLWKEATWIKSAEKSKIKCQLPYFKETIRPQIKKYICIYLTLSLFYSSCFGVNCSVFSF